jgi:hypothetical protein
MRQPLLGLILVAIAATFAGSSSATVRARTGSLCEPASVEPAYAARVEHALRAGRDRWGERLLAARGGPTLEAATHVLPPLLFAAGPRGTRLTASGVYYLPFTLPVSVGGARGFGLHVADGSQVIVRRVGGPSLVVGVGAGGRERFGSCLARLRTPRLASGYLPVLEVGYRDAAGVRYRQESFVGRLAGRSSLVSFVHVEADARGARGGGAVRLATSTGATLVERVLRGGTAELDAAFTHAGARLRAVDPGAYAAARSAVVAYWEHSLAGQPSFDVPEARVENAMRAIEIEELEMTWRYSVGNTYEELSYAEALDVAQVMSEYGFGDVARQILRYTLRQLPARFTNWRAGERLVAGAAYVRLDRDLDYVDEQTPALRAIVGRLERELAASRTGLLPRERYSSDIADDVYSLHGQTLVWQGLLAMGRVWEATGRRQLATRAHALALRLEHGLRRAVVASSRRLSDGSLFVPAALLDRGAPFRRLTDSRAGSYWNLVVPYALASGFFPPHGPAADGMLRYLRLHGSRLLGLVRAGAYRLAGTEETSFSGTDQVYGLNVARFLADEDEPDQLVLSLYGTLAAALTPGTYVSGEAASVTPIGGARYRTMYLPPNNDGAAAFLETLRLTLVHETPGRRGEPLGLELAFATPRAWLAPGRTIAVHDAPTSFGRVSYSIARHGDAIAAVVTAPPSPALRLRLRLPPGESLASVTVAGRPVRYDRATATIDLSGRTGAFEVDAVIAAA